jgi:threonine/homoserine/homoserine lactone efflux protein
MGAVGCVAGFFLCLGLLCLLLPETVAQWGTYTDTLNRERSRALLARYPRTTRWSGRIAGGLLILVGAILLFVAALGEE